jgi:hypothetical protein
MKKQGIIGLMVAVLGIYTGTNARSTEGCETFELIHGAWQSSYPPIQIRFTSETDCCAQGARDMNEICTHIDREAARIRTLTAQGRTQSHPQEVTISIESFASSGITPDHIQLLRGAIDRLNSGLVEDKFEPVKVTLETLARSPFNSMVTNVASQAAISVRYLGQ